MKSSPTRRNVLYVSHTALLPVIALLFIMNVFPHHTRADELMFEWQEKINLESGERTVTGQQFYDSVTDTEYTRYFNETGYELPQAAAKQLQKSWTGNPIVEQDSERKPSEARSGTSTAKPVGNEDAAEKGLMVVLPPPGPELLQDPGDDVPLRSGERIGIIRNLPEPVELSPSDTGLWIVQSDGTRVWSLTMEDSEAQAIRVHLQDVLIPDGCEIILFNANDPTEVVGPYNQASCYGEDNFWTESIFSSRVVLQCTADANVDLRNVQFTVDQMVHVYVDIFQRARLKVGSCHNDVTCYSSWETEAAAVAGIGSIEQGAGYLWCTGTLLADQDSSTYIDYFLTAWHCVENQSQANTLEFYWFYQTSTCNGSPPSATSVPRTGGGANWLSGANIYSGNDYAFLKLRSESPSGVAYAGWTTAAPGYSEVLTCIHHPDGSYKRISFGNMTASDSDYWTVRWYDGVTEPGSSGSPLFDSDHKLIGTLSSGDSDCATPSLPDYYGRFDVAYPVIKQWLTGSGGGGDAPDASAPISPNGSIVSVRPLFRWSSVSDASWYRIWIERGGSYYWSEWLQGLTSKQWTWNFNTGSYEWWIQTWNDYGYGPWSSGMTFTIGGGGSGPAASTPESPSGLVLEYSPAFSWSAVSDASWYQVWINLEGSYYWNQWIQGQTSTQFPWWFASGSYTWWVRTWNSSGYGPWSSSESFFVF